MSLRTVYRRTPPDVEQSLANMDEDTARVLLHILNSRADSTDTWMGTIYFVGFVIMVLSFVGVLICAGIVTTTIASRADGWSVNVENLADIVDFAAMGTQYAQYAGMRLRQTRAAELDYVQIANSSLPDSEGRMEHHVLKAGRAANAVLSIVSKVDELKLLEHADHYLGQAVNASKTPTGLRFWSGVASIFNLIDDGPDSKTWKNMGDAVHEWLAHDAVASTLQLFNRTIDQMEHDPVLRQGIIDVMAEAPNTLRAFTVLAEDKKNVEMARMIQEDMHWALKQGHFRDVLVSMKDGAASGAHIVTDAYRMGLVNRTMGTFDRVDGVVDRIFGPMPAAGVVPTRN